ncbi:Lon protease family protein [Pelagibius marinus]|uniref:Lon protease family protein n=1 Tax=Pelagibius marinus TaxID=2762760 RepID=UPI001872FDBD|nr:AAA family ATPase [Pelagibius marinus]
MAPSPLAPEKLYTHCKLDGLDFETTSELEDLAEVIGQDRALEAIHFAAEIEQEGYNLFVLGPSGTGKHTTVLRILKQKAAEEPVPPDWVYLNNFITPHQPKALSLPSGLGRELQSAMKQLVDELRAAVPAAFESEDYRNRRQALEESARERQEKAFQVLRERAEEKNIALVRTPMGFAFAPMEDGAVMEPKAFNALPAEERERIQEEIEKLQAELEEIVKQIPGWAKEHRDALRELNREVTAQTIDQPIDKLNERFGEIEGIGEHLEEVREDLLDNVHSLLQLEIAAQQQGPGETAAGPAPGPGHLNGFKRYAVNVVVSGEESEGAPVIFENNPTLANLIGRVEHISEMGALITDFTLIKGGALHRANGGYLILDVLKVLSQPLAWDALKRALKASTIRIESAGQMMSLISTVSLEPGDVPLQAKVILCGDPLYYYLLGEYDPEFATLFKVAADFGGSMDRSGSGEALFARQLATMVKQSKLRPLNRAAVARVMEHSARLAEDAEKLSINLRAICDLTREADFFAGKAGAEVTDAAHVQQAIDAQIRRADRLRERSYEAIQRGIVLLDTEGTTVGQVNGLSVLQLGHFAFGRPSRITASVRLGAGKVIDIEREVELGGPIHSKGVLILSSYLASHFAGDKPLSLAASLVFEQSYGGVEGDSASSAELYALLSALSEVPLKQNLAVTGSVNQNGHVQAIGGVNEKIEGFFDICRERGLTGDQGVLIPASNVMHLMLRQDVIDAVAAGKFHIYPVETIAQGIELLTGRPAGERDAEGRFPTDSVNRLVEDRLVAFAEARRRFGAHDEDGGKEGGRNAGN